MSYLDLYHKHPLHGFLQEFTVPPRQGQEASLCGMGQLKGRWLIPDDKYDKFLDNLDDYLIQKKGRPLNLVEQPRLDQPKPLLMDLDFKFSIDSSLNHRFNSGHIRKFIKSVSEGLSFFFNTEQFEVIRFFVSLRPQAYSAGKIVKDGIHIQSPDISLTNEKQKVLRSWLLENLAIENAFDGIEYVNDVHDIYDESMVRKQGWFLYGESKPNISPYQLTSVFAFNPETGALDEEDIGKFTPRVLLELLSVRYNVSEDINDIRPEQQDTYDRFLKPAALVLIPASIMPMTLVANENGLATVAPLFGEKGVYIPDNHDVEEVELAKQIVLECLSVKRATDYKTWMEVGWCMYNIDASEAMFEAWVEFSKKSAKAEGTDWEKYRRDWLRGFTRNTAGAKLTLKSLHYWARDDNLEKYKELIEDDHVRFAQYRISDTHFHVAKLLQRMYKGNFCASVESRKTEWFVFDERIHTWRHTNQGMELQEKLSTEVADLIIRARERLKKSGREASMAASGGNDDPDWFKKWASTVDGERFMMLVKLEKHLYQQDFKGGVMRAAIELFHEEDFSNRLNVNPYLFACRNGVLDLNNQIKDSKTGKMLKKVIFRAGRPDDYMSQLAGRNYPDSEPLEYVAYDPEDPRLQELMEFLRKIFPKDELRNYFIRLMASCLEGNNREQCYYTFIGVGGNGKSKVVDLMRYTFGEYCSSLQATALTRKRPDSGSANPDIIAIKNKRFIYLQEPDDKEPLNTSRMKQFSGEDVVEARGLFEDQQRFRISGKLCMMCNTLPPIHSMDRGTWRRIRVLRFGSKFVDASDPDLKAGRPGVYLRDNDLDIKLRGCRDVWLGLLIHIYETEYLVSGMEPVPQEVMEESNKYKESFNQYGKFKTERIIDFRDPRLGLREDGDELVTLKDIHMAYSGWTRQNEGALTGKKLTKQELQNRLEEDFGSMETGGFKRCLVFFDEDGKAEEEECRRS